MVWCGVAAGFLVWKVWVRNEERVEDGQVDRYKCLVSVVRVSAGCVFCIVRLGWVMLGLSWEFCILSILDIRRGIALIVLYSIV